MVEFVGLLSEFVGIGVEYDPLLNPFFEAIVVDTLRKIQTVDLGKTLLSRIQSATPRSRGNFPDRVNVILKPLMNGMQYNQSGFKPIKDWGDQGEFRVTGMLPSTNLGHNLTRTTGSQIVNCPFWKDGTSANQAVDRTSDSNGQGTVCYVRFSNAQFMTSKGEMCDSFIVLAHELIHSLHCLEGTSAGDKEELWTSGEGIYQDDPMTEAAFRRAFGLPARSGYYN